MSIVGIKSLFLLKNIKNMATTPHIGNRSKKYGNLLILLFCYLKKKIEQDNLFARMPEEIQNNLTGKLGLNSPRQIRVG